MEQSTDARPVSLESPDGPAWAALLAASIGAAAFGLITDASECSARVSRSLQWYRPAGALSGVAIGAIVIWVVAWVALHVRWRGMSFQNRRTPMSAILLLALVALVTTFPPFYELFGG